jgi:AraC-like DNA-binding protein
VVTSPDPETGGLIEWQRRRIARYIDQHLALPIENVTLSHIARRSIGHFHRAFKQSFGLSPQSYIMERRLEQAVTQMRSTRASLAEIAQACGFADQSHLSKLFRARYGTAPSYWRRQHVE